MANLFAHYCANKTITICDNIRGVGGKVIAVSGKREARLVAQKFNAQPWNF